MFSNYQSFQLRFPSGGTVSQQQVLRHLNSKGIAAQPGILPIHWQKFYASVKEYHLPQTDTARREVVMLPIYHSLSDDEQQFVIDSVLELVL